MNRDNLLAALEIAGCEVKEGDHSPTLTSSGRVSRDMRTVELLTGVPLGETQVLLSQQTNENLVDLIESATEQLVDDGDAETIAEMLGAVLTVAK